MTTSKLNRKKLALRLFALLVVVNSILLMLFAPSTKTKEPSHPISANEIEIQIKAKPYLAFQKFQPAMLLNEAGATLGPIEMIEQQEDHLTIRIQRSVYQIHYRSLIQDEWALIPVVSPARSLQRKGAYYEIAY